MPLSPRAAAESKKMAASLSDDALLNASTMIYDEGEMAKTQQEMQEVKALCETTLAEVSLLRGMLRREAADGDETRHSRASTCTCNMYMCTCT